MRVKQAKSEEISVFEPKKDPYLNEKRNELIVTIRFIYVYLILYSRFIVFIFHVPNKNIMY